MSEPGTTVGDDVALSSQEPSLSQRTFKLADFYCVYLLNSVNKRNTFYIGSTPNPSRRLQQHNGHRTMGAKRTRKELLRPWEMVLVVHGFCSNIAALQFETAMQKPHQTRHLHDSQRVVTRAGGKRSIHQHLATIRLLIQSPYFLRMNLKVDFFNYEPIYQLWIENKYGIHVGPGVVSKQFNDAGDCHAWHSDTLKQQVKKVDTVRETKNGLDCDICSEPVLENESTGKNWLLSCYHQDCFFASHLRCLADKFLADEHAEKSDFTQARKEGSKYFQSSSLSQLSQSTKRMVAQKIRSQNGLIQLKPLLPIKGPCPKCTRMLYWTQLVRVASTRQAQTSGK